MPIKIHHGPNGSFKTSGAVWDDAVPAMKDGRTIVTNIRGFSYERCIKAFPDLPETFDVVHIDTDTSIGIEQARTWFQWAPRDSFIIFDETQNIFLKRWTDKDIQKFDYPGGIDAANAADRPQGFLDAWTRQRHWNWDIVLTTPNIRYIRDDIRQTCETAYIHANLGVLGGAMKLLLNADYKEAMHGAQDNKPPADGSTIVAMRKINKKVFELYDSTATGKHRDTFTGKNLLGSPKVLGLLAFLALLVGSMYYRTGFSLFTNGVGVSGSSAPSSASVSVPAKGSPQTAPVASHGPDKPVPDRSGAEVSVGPFDGHTISIKAALHSKAKGVIYLFQLADGSSTFEQSTKDMRVAGYDIRSRGLCAAELTFKGTTRTVICSGSGNLSSTAKRPEERSSAAQKPSGAVSAARVTVVNSGKPGHLW